MHVLVAGTCTYEHSHTMPLVLSLSQLACPRRRGSLHARGGHAIKIEAGGIGGGRGEKRLSFLLHLSCVCLFAAIFIGAEFPPLQPTFIHTACLPDCLPFCLRHTETMTLIFEGFFAACLSRLFFPRAFIKPPLLSCLLLSATFFSAPLAHSAKSDLH